MRTQLVTSIKVRRGPANDNRDFEPVVRRAHQAGHRRQGLRLREEPREGGAPCDVHDPGQDVPVWRTNGRYRKEMKRAKKKYHQRSKAETVFSVIKRTTSGR
ncbi:MAG: hypothetical protein JRN39_02735 [Nitrososphaerota archaeon]|nr:hypothetical protein [Nitrososphaerota archaeon]